MFSACRGQHSEDHDGLCGVQTQRHDTGTAGAPKDRERGAQTWRSPSRKRRSEGSRWSRSIWSSAPSSEELVSRELPILLAASSTSQRTSNDTQYVSSQDSCDGNMLLLGVQQKQIRVQFISLSWGENQSNIVKLLHLIRFLSSCKLANWKYKFLCKDYIYNASQATSYTYTWILCCDNL